MASLGGGSSSSNQQSMSQNAYQNSDSANANSFMNQNVWGGQSPYLQNMYGMAQALYGDKMGELNRMTPGAMNFQNQQAQGAAGANAGMQQGGVYGGLGIGNQLMDSLKQSQNSPSNMQQINSMIMGGNGNNYLDAMKGTLETDAARSNQLNQATNTAQAAASGMSGGSRQGVMDALNQDNVNKNLQSTEAQLGYNSFNEDLQRKLGIAQQADTNTFNRQNLMSGMLGQQQNTVNQGIQNTGNIQQAGMGQFNVSNQPWNSFQQYANALGGPSILNSGGSNSSSQGQGSGWGFGNSSGSSKGGQAGASIFK
jgi:hypothetical protein